jgi:alanyl-tRNA synthetase
MKSNKPTTSNEIRQAFLDFFNEVGHEVVPSAPLPQHDNPTLLFTNAGMNQFANVFLGKEKRPYSRAATAQKCMRVQGKHNDLENVGPSQRHHTFFEMLGNFSFGDYFKSAAIDYGWAFLTQVVGLEPERLWATIYDDDDEAFALWRRYLPAEKILRFGKKENYWEMGDVGPNGPCSEIHYYRGDLAHVDASLLNDDDDLDENFLEVWNLVFMQYETDEEGHTTPLPKPSIDTGLGLERLTRILQNGDSNYDTDLFLPAMDRVQELLGDSDERRARNYVGYRVIADHGRAATFMIADGVRPSSTGAGYVLRMITRRAARFGRKIGFTEPFLAEIAQVYIDQMGGDHPVAAYPELKRRREHVLRTITQEERKFERTLDKGLTHLDEVVAGMKQRGAAEIPGKQAFDLYATYGLPLEITRDVVQEQGITVDEAGFKKARDAHAEASGAGKFGQYEMGANVYADALNELIEAGQLEDGVEHDPYSGSTAVSEVVAIFKDGQQVESAAKGEKVEVVTAVTPFYVESGGEVSDTGRIEFEGGGDAASLFRVDDTRRPVAGMVVHVGEVISGQWSVGQEVTLVVDNGRRWDIRRNHTATHLLHRELRAHLGKHVTQAGSLVASDRLRFDFTHDEAVDRQTLAQIEAAINDAILANQPVTVTYMGQEEAIDKGAMALFGEKYGDIVRTIKIGEAAPENAYSFELCGGLHVSETAEIGLFRFIGEGASSAGVRRVEAVTGHGAQKLVAERLDTLDQVAGKLNAPLNELVSRLDGMMAEMRAIQKELEKHQRQSARGQFEALLDQVQQIGSSEGTPGVNVLAAQVDVADVDGLREMADWFRDKVGSGTAVLATVLNDKPLIVATVTDDLIKRGLKAGDLVREVAQMVGGGGGGRPNMAQAGGRDASKLPEALTAVTGLVEKALL